MSLIAASGARTMSTFTLDPFHPEILRCQDGGEAVANLADLAQADELPADVLTCRQTLRVWPGAARAGPATSVPGWRHGARPAARGRLTCTSWCGGSRTRRWG